jgi:hypothetical protein
MTPRTLILTLAATSALVMSAGASANGQGPPILVDPFGAACPAQHKTVVGPDTYSAGSTIVAVAQTGRFTDRGACDNGFATSTNNGMSWTSGVLPGITIYTNPPGPYARAGDPSIAFDARHNEWIAVSLALNTPGPVSPIGVAVLASRSTTGGLTWTNPVTIAVAGSGENFEKPWIACDNTSTSPNYGSCATQWDDLGHGKQFRAAFSRDGLTWTQARTPNVGVIGGQPVFQPNGTAIMPIDNASETALGVSISTDGGASWGAVRTITSITAATDPGGIRSSPLPSAEIDKSGKVFVTWEDCRFRPNCSTNDLVYTTSSNGTTWTAVQRIPADPSGINGTQDTLIPGIGVDKSSSGTTTHVSVTYYYFPNVNCSEATCDLFAGSISSTNGGTTWSAQVTLRGPMKVDWFPNTTQGRTLGDYISTSFGSDGTSHGAVIAANSPTSGFDVALYDPPTRFR